MSRDHRLMLLAAATAAALASCGPAAQPVQTGPAPAPPPVAREIAKPSGPSKDAPLDRSIGELTTGEERQVRIKGGSAQSSACGWSRRS